MPIAIDGARLITVGRVPPSPTWGTTPASHRHHELIVIRKGSLHLWIEGNEQVCSAGDVLFYRAGLEHEEHSDPIDPVETFFLAFEMPDEPRGHALRVRDLDGRLRQIASWLYLEWPDRAVGTGTLCDTYFTSMLLEWDLLHRRDEPDLVARIRRYMRSHIGTHIDLDGLALESGLSKYHFIRRYRQLAGRTPMEDLRAERVRYAQQLIVDTDLPMKDVASRSGLCDEYHLGHLIKRYLKVTPGEMRASRHWEKNEV